MKKRLLSAALAFAMVLTMIPATIVTAFAAAADPVVVTSPSLPSAGTSGLSYTVTKSDGTVETKYYYNVDGTRITTFTVQRCTQTETVSPGNVKQYGHWYFLANQGDDRDAPKYYEIDSGIVTGTGGSGQWYPDVGDYTRNTTKGDQVKGAFTVLSDTLNLSSYVDSSLTLAITKNLSTLTIPAATLTNLRITAPFQDTSSGGVAQKGAVNAISIDRSTSNQGDLKTGLTVTADNISFGSISLEGRTNNLTLTNCEVTGNVKMDGSTRTVAGAGDDNAWYGQTIKATNTPINGTLDIDGDNSNITLTDSPVTGAITVDGNGGSVNISGISNVTGGNVTTTPRTTTGQWPSVTVTGGSLAGIQQGAFPGNKNKMKVSVSGSTTQVSGISVLNGDVTINSADVKGWGVMVQAGTLTISGSGVDISGTENITLGAVDVTDLKISATGSTFGGITAADGNNLKISQWNPARQSDGGNYYGTLDLGVYDGKKVTGGTFALGMAPTFQVDSCLKWLDTTNLQFAVWSGSNLDLYGKTELAEAISDIGTANAKQPGHMMVLGQGAGGADLVLVNGQNVLARIRYNTDTILVLPEKINNYNINTWFAPDNRNVSFASGTKVTIPYRAHVAATPPATPDVDVAGSMDADGLILNATATNAGANRLTKAVASGETASVDGAPVVNQNVVVTLNNNDIHVTGAVTPNASGVATVKVDLYTDAVDNDGNFIVLRGVSLNYDVESKTIKFNSILPEDVLNKGALVQNDKLVLNNGTGESYTVSASLNESASKLGIASLEGSNKGIAVTFGGNLSRLTDGQKKQITDEILGNDARFTYGANQAMQQAINTVQATVTNNSAVENWIKTAKNNVWSKGFKSPDTSLNVDFGYVTSMTPHKGSFDSSTPDGTTIADAFKRAYVVPYLVINLTDYNPDGTLSATLTPYYRIDVSGAAYNPDMAYTVQQGRALTLTGDITSATAANRVKVKLAPATNFQTKYMHQDGKYVYQAAGGQWMISHIGANGTLGSIVVNSNPGLVSIAQAQQTGGPTPIPNRTPLLTSLNCTYDTLQAAMDDTARGTTIQNAAGAGQITTETMDSVVIDGKYKGDCTVTMNGIARKVFVLANGQQNVTTSAKDVSVQTAGGYSYYVELKSDNVAAGTVAIVVSGNANGSASLSTSVAKVGETVTVTVVPKAGVTVTGVTAKTNTGAAVTVTYTGTANQYTFVVPTGATSITVTPVFKGGTTTTTKDATISVTASNMGTATPSLQKAPAGSSVNVTVNPAAGYRTMGVSVSTNGGTTTAFRQSTNNYTFIVPANATAVTVTPTYDRDNGTPFVDVWSTSYYSDAVAWAVSKGITDGINAYTFGSNNTCTRGQMVTFLYRAAGSPAVGNVSNPFVDLSPNDYFYNAALWAVSKGITNGVDSTHFGGSRSVTRAQAVTFLYRYANSPAAGSNSGFYDVGSNEYYAKAVTWAVNQGITNGKTSTSFAPNAACQRCEIMTFLYRDLTGNRA